MRMKILNLTLAAIAAVGVFVFSAVSASAQFPVISETWVSGTVYDGGGSPVSGGTVTVTCNGVNRFAGILSNGSYGVAYPQTECKVGDTVTASASTGAGSGSNSASVVNTPINGPIVDLDIAVIDITVPEFGLIGGMLTGMGSVAGYMYLRAKALV